MIVNFLVSSLQHVRNPVFYNMFAAKFSHICNTYPESDPDKKITHITDYTSGLRHGIMYLEFDDITYETDTYPNVVIFNKEMAAQVLNFVHNEHSAGINWFLINCNAGISRSIGMAIGLSKIFNNMEDNPEKFIYTNTGHRYCVNGVVGFNHANHVVTQTIVKTYNELFHAESSWSIL